MTTRKAQRTVRTLIAAVLAGSLSAIGTVAGSAGAVGNATLNKQLVSPAGSGWKTYSVATVQNLVKTISSSEDISTATLHGHASVAAQLWHRGPRLSLQIALVAITSTTQPNTKLATQVKNSALLSAKSFCQGSVGQAPAQTGRIPSIPHSVVGECPLVNGRQYVIVAWVKANVLAIMATTLQAVNLSDLVKLSIRQYRSMSASDFGSTNSSSGSSTVVILAVVVVLALLGAGAYGLNSSRRRSSASNSTPS